MYLLYQKLEQRECIAATCTCLVSIVEHENNLHTLSLTDDNELLL